jgi:hypothetical protein
MKTSKPVRQIKQKKTTKFRFVIRKYVIASSVQQALKYEHKSPVHEVFVADRAEDRAIADPIGFEYTAPETID